VMFDKIISTIGFGILGIDPIAALYLIALEAKKEKKGRITLFFLTFAGFSILFGAVLAAIFGVAAAELLASITPNDDSPLWAVLELAISIFIFVWIIGKIRNTGKKKEKANNFVEGSTIKYLTTGFAFALSCFTDPTYYAVILMGGESGNFFKALLLLTLWFLISQFMAVIVYVAHELNLLDKLVAFVDRFKAKNLILFTNIFYMSLLAIAIVLIANIAFLLYSGKYLF
jgi:MFS family permease